MQSREYGGEYGGRWCFVSSRGFTIFCCHSCYLVHLQSVNNTLIEEKVSYFSVALPILLVARESCIMIIKT